MPRLDWSQAPGTKGLPSQASPQAYDPRPEGSVGKVQGSEPAHQPCDLLRLPAEPWGTDSERL